MDKVRIATVGRSAITERFLDALGQVPEAEYVAAYSRKEEDARAFAEAHGAQLAFSSLEELAASDKVDAVYIGSPNALHAEQAKTLLAGGKHVLVEKSFAANRKLAEEVFGLAHEQGLVALEAARNTFGPGAAYLKDAVSKTGKVRLATFRFSKVTSRIKKLEAGEHVNIFDPHMAAGALMDIGVYCVESALQVFGAPESVKASAVTHQVEGRSADDPYTTIDLAGEAILSYPGFLVNLSYGKVSNDYLASQIEGSAGTLFWKETSCPRTFTFTPYVDKGMVYGTVGGEGAETTSVDMPENDMQFELASFVHAIQGDSEALAEAAEHEKLTLASLAVMDDIRRQCGIVFPEDR